MASVRDAGAAGVQTGGAPSGGGRRRLLNSAAAANPRRLQVPRPYVLLDDQGAVQKGRVDTPVINDALIGACVRLRSRGRERREASRRPRAPASA